MTIQTYESGPPQGRGHYDPSGKRWWDGNLGRWFPIGSAVDELEITVQEVGRPSRLRRFFAKLTGSLGKTRYCFVGEASSDDPRWPCYRLVGAGFPVLRGQPVEELAHAGPGSDLVRSRLSELEVSLVAHGWRPSGQGESWWALSFARPAVTWPDEVLSSSELASEDQQT